MNLQKLSVTLLAGAGALGALAPVPSAAQDSIFFPVLVYRTGAYAPTGIPAANGIVDYYKLLNERDGGINGVKLAWEECETQYDTKLGVECYERLKSKNPVIVFPYSTGITYALIEKAPVDKIPILSMGYGRTDASDGRVFPWTFTTPTTYWSQASAVVRYIASREGGLDKLKGKTIGLVYHNSPYGKEAIPTLEALAAKHGYKLELLAVDHPGQEQKATWLKVRQLKPDWIFVRGWGVMTQVSIKEAAATGFKMDRLIGNWWSSAEPDVVPAGDGAKGYIGATFHAPGTKFKLHEDMVKHVYDKGKGTGKKEELGQVLWNRGMLNALIATEAVRVAQAQFKTKVVTGEQVRWGMENLNITDARWKELGLENFTKAIKTSCADHEGNGPVIFQQWDGKEWKIISDWFEPMRDVVRPMIEASAAQYAKEKNITARADCK
jgi:branched-chain amino acid transport system substrate-binding protein